MMTKRRVYECVECGSETRILSDDEPAVYCGCEPEGPPMTEKTELVA